MPARHGIGQPAQLDGKLVQMLAQRATVMRRLLQVLLDAATPVAGVILGGRSYSHLYPREPTDLRQPLLCHAKVGWRRGRSRFAALIENSQLTL
jgi:hypothetical protein